MTREKSGKITQQQIFQALDFKKEEEEENRLEGRISENAKLMSIK